MHELSLFVGLFLLVWLWTYAVLTLRAIERVLRAIARRSGITDVEIQGER